MRLISVQNPRTNLEQSQS